MVSSVSNEPLLLTTRHAAKLLSCSKQTLEAYRYAGIGPRYVKFDGGRGIRYSRRDLESWAAERTVDPAKGGGR